MAIAIYNPHYFKTGGKITENKADIEGFVWSHAKWDLEVNESKSFPDEVGRALLKHYDFLEKVTHKNIEDIKKRQKQKLRKCPYCDFKTLGPKVALDNHVKSCKPESGDEKSVGGIKKAEPSGTAGKRPIPSKKKVTPESIEKGAGISKNKGFYGPGLEKDTLADMRVNKPNKKGYFKG